MSHGHDSSIPFWVQKVHMTVAVIGVDEGINSRNHMDNDIESLGELLKDQRLCFHNRDSYLLSLT